MIGRRILPRAGRAALACNASRPWLAPCIVTTRQCGGPVRLYMSKGNYVPPREFARRLRPPKSATNQQSRSFKDSVRRSEDIEATVALPQPKPIGKETRVPATRTKSPLSLQLKDSVVRRVNVIRTSKFRNQRLSATVRPDKFRDLMRPIPHPVAVITTLHLPDFSHPRTWNAVKIGQHVERWTTPLARAMTVSSLVSLSVEPEPQIIFNVTLPSITFRAIKSSKRFNVHVLRDTPMAARIAKHFSQSQVRSPRIGPLALDNAHEFGITVEPPADVIERQWNFYRKKAFQNKKFKPFTPLSKDSVPRMLSPDIMYVLQCSVRFNSLNDPAGKSGPIPGGLVTVDGNNAIVIGVVEDVVLGPVAKNGDAALLYGNRKFMHAQDGTETPTPEPTTNTGIIARLAAEAREKRI